MNPGEQQSPGQSHPAPVDMFSQSFWDTRYGSVDRVWSGQPNVHLVRHVSGLRPGTALDVGCGEGADSIWLARRDWHVTAVDVSVVALGRVASNAQQAGVADRVTFEHADLRTWDPSGRRFDLVSAQYMHLPRPQLQVLFTGLARAVAPGGTLLVVGHHPDDPHIRARNDPPDMYLTAEDLQTSLEPRLWERVHAGSPEREVSEGTGGGTRTARDAVLLAVRQTTAKDT